MENQIVKVRYITGLSGTEDSYQLYKKQAMDIKKYAESMVITTEADLKAVTNDLVVIANLKRGIERKRQEYVKPINDHVKSINTAFKELSDPVEEADRILRDKMGRFNQAQEMRRRMAEEVNRQAEELARKQAELSGTGEITVDVTPVPVPAAPATHVRTEMGTAGTIKTRKARVIDFAKLPDAYKLPNERLLATAASTSVQEIAGVEFYIEESIRITGRR